MVDVDYRARMYAGIAALICIVLIGMSGCEEPEPPEPPLTMEVSTSSINFPASGGMESFLITSNTNWTVSGSSTSSSDYSWLQPWLQVSATSGKNNESIGVTVTRNSLEPRAATIYVRGADTLRTINVTQTELVPSLIVSVESLRFSSSKESKTFTISSNISWTVSSTARWLTFSQTSGSDNETITVTATNAETNVEQKASIVVSARSYNITHTIDVFQEAGDWYLNISTDSLNFSSSAESKSFTISSNTNWIFECGYYSEWFSMKDRTCNHTFSNDETIIVSVTENTSSLERTGRISVKSNATGTQIIDVFQAGATPTLSALPSSIEFSAVLNEFLNRRNFTVYSNTSWTVSSDATWFTISPTSGSNRGSVEVLATENNTSLSERAATIIVNAGDLSATVEVTQAKAIGSISFYTSINFGTTIYVTLNGYGTKGVSQYYILGGPTDCKNVIGATFSDLPHGTYSYTYTWGNNRKSGTVTLENICSLVYLSQ